MGVRGAGRHVNFFLRGIEPTELNIFEDRIVKQECFLRDESDLVSERVLRQAAQVVTINSDRAGRRIIKAQEKRKNGALSRTARADQRVTLSGFDTKVQILDRIADAARVTERDILKFEQAF